LFTGDIGRARPEHRARESGLPGPQSGESADIVVMESTYGNRSHPKDDPRPELAELIKRRSSAEARWSRPRSQLSAHRNRFHGQRTDGIRPGAARPHFATARWRSRRSKFPQAPEEYSDATKQLISRYGSPLKWTGLTFAQTAEESKKINDYKAPCIIISSSGW
jgi:metallo-beta-lactamase family protein